MLAVLFTFLTLGIGAPADGYDRLSDLPDINYESPVNPGEGDLVFNSGFIGEGSQIPLPSELPRVLNFDAVTLFLVLQSESFTEVRLDYLYLSEIGAVGDLMDSALLDAAEFQSSTYRYPYQLQSSLSCDQGELPVALRITATNSAGEVESYYTAIQLVPTQNGAPCHGGILVGNPLNSDQESSVASAKVSHSMEGCGSIRQTKARSPWWAALLMILGFCWIRLRIQREGRSEN